MREAARKDQCFGLSSTPRRRNTASTGLDRGVDNRLIGGIEEVLQPQQASQGVNRGRPHPS